MFSKAEVVIVLTGTNHFRPNEIVKGEVVVTAKKDFFLDVLECVFRGELEIFMKRYVEKRQGLNNRRYTETYCDNHLLINNYVDLGVGSDGVMMNKGDSKSFKFEFIFPEFATCRSCGRGTRLPSTNFSTFGSVDNVISTFGSSDSVECRVSVAYTLNASAEPDSTFGKSRGRALLIFTQTGDKKLMLYSDNASSYSNVQLWKGKIKKFVDSNYEEYGEENVATEGVECIRNPLDEAHNHSRSVRKLFNGSYKKENYSKLVGDVRLELELFVKNRVIYASQDVRDCFFIVIRTRIPHLQPNYLLYSKKSSQLGLFSIRSATIALIRKYTVTAEDMRRTFEERTNIIMKRYGHELTFDIVDFTPNYQDPTLLEWAIPLKEILFPENVLITSNISNYRPNYLSGCSLLDITHLLSVTLSVSEDFEDTPKSIEFVYAVKLM
ncbi:hypothetical protein CLIB1423_12S03290 [[Candida] railenensis]|uniref:Uncharacterized protein n=1 Tax=[Candida] railenensis TaxID=45579 RepID=A0A9P0QSH9_9ASCO|nr:hypothetical protein CLIB1423_12S03290 [[Candida] railenensis]